MATNKTTTKLKRLIGVNSEKGGAGKSAFSRSFLDYVRSLPTPIQVAAYDLDGSVGGLIRTHGTRNEAGNLDEVQDPTVGVDYYNVRREKTLERHAFLDKLSIGYDVILKDLAGGSLEALTMITDSGDGLDELLSAIEENGYRMTIAHMIVSDVGATHSVATWLEMAGDRVDHVAVINDKYTEVPYWYGFKSFSGVEKGGKAREKLLDMGGVEIHLPAVPDGTFAKVDAENFPYSKVNEVGLLSVTERHHITKFRKEFAKEIQKAAPFLGLE